METGYDIIFFWVARMMMLGIELTGEAPFHTIVLSGLIRDPFGKKMSKTTGNVVDPLAVMAESGADALRFALIHGATPGQDQRFGPQKLENARNFANKLWNAARFVIGARPASVAADAIRPGALDEALLGSTERWIRSRAAATTTAVDRGLGDYLFAEVTRALYDGIWSEFCDWGIELAKVRLADESLGEAQRAATWWTLVDALDTYLRLLHPVMPFVTEAIWGTLPRRAGDPDLLMVARWPDAAGHADPALDDRFAEIIETIVAIRNARATANAPAGAWLETHLALPADAFEGFEAVAPAIGRLARARPLTLHRDAAGLPRPEGALEVVLPTGDVEATVILAAASDSVAVDRVRLEKELADAEGHLAAARARLANTSFTERAPAAVVEGARAREAELSEQVDRLRARLGR
jgi:valyl-tRNA synthetase